MKQFFKIREDLTEKQKTFWKVFGIFSFLLIWELLPRLGLVSEAILPGPIKVLRAFYELWFVDALGRNMIYSIILNSLGYLLAVAVALPLGYSMGLFPKVKALLEQPVSAARYLPITALIGLFILWFGIGAIMKVIFLGVGILVYLLPTVVQRVDDVDPIYVDTVKTLGAKRWQTFQKVFLPGALADIFNDVRVLIAISWTYIIAVEIVNMNDGGIGALIQRARLQSRVDKSIAILFVIIVWGFFQDMGMKGLSRLFFKHKYQGGKK